MLSTRSILLAVTVALAGLGWLFAESSTHHAQDSRRLASLNRIPIDTGRCFKHTAAQACEDVRIHHPSGTAFLACGFPETRHYFYPPIDKLDPVNAATYREYFVKYDITSNTTVPLRVEGLDPSHDLILHGLDVFIPPGEDEDGSTIYIFAVNHVRQGEEVLVFSHQLHSDVVISQHVFKHSKIKTPNAVAAHDLNSFFITNDHWFYGATLGGLLRRFEHKFGPFWGGSDVVYCSFQHGSLGCKTVSPPRAHLAANGILVMDGGQTLAVNDLGQRTTSLYSIHPDTKMLTLKRKVQLGAAVDNVSLIPGSEDLVVCVFPDISKVWRRLSQPLDRSRLAEAVILRLKKANDYKPEVIYEDDGSLVSVLTGAAVDPLRHRLIAGGVVQDYFLVCDTSSEAL